MISAAMVFNVARFSAWPDDAQGAGHFEVCYEAGGGMADALATIEGKEVAGRLVQAVPVDGQSAPRRRCHVYFVDGRASEEELLAAAERGSLTVGRDDRFLRRGGAVRLSMEGRPRFSVNVRAARTAGVRPSSKLLRLAEEVVE